MMLEFINKLHADKTLKKLFEAGFLNQKAFIYRTTYIYFDQQVRTGMKVSAAVDKTSAMTKMTPRTIYKIIKIMKSDA